MKTTILYKTDFNQSFASRDIIGVFTNKTLLNASVMKLIKEDILANPEDRDKEENKNYIGWNFDFFLEKGQTQGLSSFELFAEEIDTNVIF